MLPSPLELLILVAASFRVWRLLAIDEILAPWRDRLTGATATEQGWEFERPRFAAFLTCPYCAGFWVSLAVYTAWLAEPRPTLYAMMPFAISAAVGLIAANLDD